MQDVVGGGWRNKLAYLGLTDLQMPIIHTWNVSLNMWNYHTNYRCSPWPACPCRPLCASGHSLGHRKQHTERQKPSTKTWLVMLVGRVYAHATGVALHHCSAV